jgi:hypothetical protein
LERAANEINQRLLLSQFEAGSVRVGSQVHGGRFLAAISFPGYPGPQLSPCPEHADILEEIIALRYLETYPLYKFIGIKACGLAGVSHRAGAGYGISHLMQGISACL